MRFKTIFIFIVSLVIASVFLLPHSASAAFTLTPGQQTLKVQGTDQTYADAYNYFVNNPQNTTHRPPADVSEWQRYLSSIQSDTVGWGTSFKNFAAGTADTVTFGGISKEGAAQALDKVGNALQCTTNPFSCAEALFYKILQLLGNLILAIVSWILWATGVLFNFTILVLVVHMKDVLDSMGGVFVIWKVLRDFANMFFIFILLYIAISTILDQSSKWRGQIIQVILVAIFLNFSFFVTSFVIDVSNLTAIQFYKGFSSANCTTGASSAGAAVNSLDGCISKNIVDQLYLPTLYSPTESPNVQIATGVAARYQFMVVVVFGSILMIIVSGIFLASSILLIYRFVELIFLLMTSPIAFVSSIVPGLDSAFGKQWRERLTNQVIFAPVYFMFLWICMTFIGSGALQSTLSLNGASLTEAFKGAGQQLFSLIINYIIIISMLGYSLVLAKQIGGKGFSGAVETATKAKGWLQNTVGRNTVGWAGSRIANSGAMKDYMANNPTMGKYVQMPFKSLGNATFVGKGGKTFDKKPLGFEGAEKEFIKQKEEIAKSLGPSITEKEGFKNSLAAAKSVQETKRTEFTQQVENTIAEQTKASKQQTDDAAAEVTRRNAQIAKMRSIEADASMTDEQKTAARQKREESEKIVAQKSEFIEKETKRINDLSSTKNKKDMVDDLLKPFNIAVENLEEMVGGVSKDKEAKSRAEADALKYMTDFEEQARKEGATGDAFTKRVKAIRDKYVENRTRNLQGGIEAVRKEQFATAAEKQRFVRSSTRKSAAEAIRKTIKGKSTAEKFYEDAKKAAKEEADAEKEDKPAEDKPKSDDKKEDKE